MLRKNTSLSTLFVHDKKILSIAIFCILPWLCVSSQYPISEYDILIGYIQPENTMYLINTIEYEHSIINGSNATTEMMIDYTPSRRVSVRGGFHISTHNLYQLSAKGNFKLLTNNLHSLILRNQYVYSMYASDNIQNMNMSLAMAYDYEYCYIAVGGYAQFHTGITNKKGIKRNYIWEPGIVYDIEARVFKKQHVWNIGIQITNMREFLIEKLYNPNFLLKGNYRFGGEGSNHLNLMLKAGFQPGGMLHMTTNYYSFYFNIGISCVI